MSDGDETEDLKESLSRKRELLVEQLSFLHFKIKKVKADEKVKNWSCFH